MSEDAKRFCIPLKLVREFVQKFDEVAKAPDDHFLVIQVDYNAPHTSSYYYVYIVEDIKVLTGPISTRGRVLGPAGEE